MQHLRLAVLFLSLVASTGLAQELSAQSAGKLVGTWSRVARVGSDACQVDQQMIFRADGTATLRYGYLYEACTQQSTEEIDEWSFRKQSVNVGGKEKKGKVIWLGPAGDKLSTPFVVKELKNGYLKIQAEIVRGDTTHGQVLIFRREDANE